MELVQTEREVGRQPLTMEPEQTLAFALKGQSLTVQPKSLLALAETLCLLPALGTSYPCASTSRETAMFSLLSIPWKSTYCCAMLCAAPASGIPLEGTAEGDY